MTKLLIAISLLSLVACGPLSKAKGDKKTAVGQATSEDVVVATGKSKGEPVKQEGAVSYAESMGKDADDDQDAGPNQSPNQSPTQAPPSRVHATRSKISAVRQ